MSSILIVEDEVLTSEYLEFVLQKAGYEVVPASSAEEAITILEHRDDVDLVVTDINLPGGLNGLQLAAVVRDRWPSVKTASSISYCVGEGKLCTLLLAYMYAAFHRCCSASNRNAARAASYSRSATPRSGVPGFALSRAINAAITRSVVFFHSGYQG